MASPANPMAWKRPWGSWLETHWVAPAYGGGLLLTITLFFFGAATNTMAGWLYVMSGGTAGLLIVAAWLPPRALRGLRVERLPLPSGQAGKPLTVTLRLHNPTPQPCTFIQILDPIPPSLGTPPTGAIAHIPPQSHSTWAYTLTPPRRGLYGWPTVTLRTAAPLGLFWARRSLALPTQLVIYPRLWPLRHCPALASLTGASGANPALTQRAAAAQDGLTRALRPYRWGDPTRLIHWRTSARYGELRVRELEQSQGQTQGVIALDTQGPWQPEAFEAAVSAAASLYHHGRQQQRAMALWLGGEELLQHPEAVMRALAGVMPAVSRPRPAPTVPLLWLSAQPPPSLAPGSIWLTWGPLPTTAPLPWIWMGGDRPLGEALQSSPQL